MNDQLDMQAMRFTFGVCWDFFPTENETEDWQRLFGESVDYWSLPLEVFGSYGGPIKVLAQTFRTMVPIALRTQRRSFQFDAWDPVHQSLLEDSCELFKPAWVALDELAVALPEMKPLQDRLQLRVRPGVAFALPLEIFTTMDARGEFSIQASQVWREAILHTTVFQLLLPLDRWLAQIAQLSESTKVDILPQAKAGLLQILTVAIQIPQRIAEVRLSVDDTLPVPYRLLQSDLVEFLVSEVPGLSLTLAWSGERAQWPLVKREIHELQALRARVQTNLSEVVADREGSNLKSGSAQLTEATGNSGHIAAERPYENSQRGLSSVKSARHTRTLMPEKLPLRWQKWQTLEHALTTVFPFSKQHLGVELWEKSVLEYFKWLAENQTTLREIETFPLFLRDHFKAASWPSERWDLLRYELALFTVKFHLEVTPSTASPGALDPARRPDKTKNALNENAKVKLNPTLDILRSAFDIPRWIFSQLEGRPAAASGPLALRRTHLSYEPIETYLDWKQATVLDALFESGSAMAIPELLQELNQTQNSDEWKNVLSQLLQLELCYLES